MTAKSQKELFAATFVAPMLVLIETLYRYTLALWAVQSQLDGLTSEEEKKKALLTTVAEKALDVRSEFMTAAEFIWRTNKNVLKRIDDIRKGRGYTDRSNDLIALSALYTSRFEEAADKINVTQEKIDNMAKLGLELIALIDYQKSGNTEIEEMKLLRDQAYTLFFDTYEKIRHAGMYMFWEDEEKLADYPSLHSIIVRDNKSDAPKKSKPSDKDEPSVDFME